VYNYAKFALNMPGGCLSLLDSCRAAAANGDYNYFSICSEAQSMCRDNVEGVYYS
jgi:hypothetical protein